ncbi:DUF4307 domain-containing protein [Microbacterium telephonicum]|uniref:Uncharacterized protein DUF4307 n=1 Tax=Microbacterium telephonicum TaxID=1714841 RepID=A0A498BZV8_9MICO|nr:DUF4307 domain-containing protein [Microbacterium telephonicum]RLK49015.1 uncharacterized protein DUF4307 [Microbacterium telephonicum]
MSSPTAPMTSPAALDDRYGRTRRRRWPWIVFGAVVLGIVGWYGWSTVSTSLDAIDTDATGFAVVDERTVTVDFQTTGRANVPIACALEAQDVEHGVVGWRIVQYPADPSATRSFSETIPTTAEATTGLVTSCWIP